MESVSKNKERSSNERIKTIKKALFGAFLSVIPAGQAESAEFLIGTDWISGAVTMKYEMENNKNEFAGLFVVAPEEKGKWFNPVEGDHDSVGVDFEKDLDVVDDYVVNSGSEDVFRVCVAHTHPADNHESYDYGPSNADFSVDAQFINYIQKEVTEVYKVDVEVNGMVFERHGVWYYTLLDPTHTFDTNTMRGAKTGELMNKFRESLETPTKVGQSTTHLLTTQLMLARKGIDARFVDYESFYQEPPCAGASYKGK